MTVTERKPDLESTRAVAQLPLPVGVWREIIEFLAKKQSGQITLHVQDGKVTDTADIFMRLRTGKNGD